jgi:hypothetical protein
MDGFREQRSDSSNDQRDNLLDSLHECDTYKELSKKRRDPEDITSIEQIEPKKSSLNDIHNFYSRLERGYNHKQNCIDIAIQEIQDLYDKLIEGAFMAYGIDREFIMKHPLEIRVIHRNPTPYHELTEIFIEHHKHPFWTEKLFTIVKDNMLYEYGTEIRVDCKARVIMEYDGQEIEQIKQYIKEVFAEEKEN